MTKKHICGQSYQDDGSYIHCGCGGIKIHVQAVLEDTSKIVAKYRNARGGRDVVVAKLTATLDDNTETLYAMYDLIDDQYRYTKDRSTSFKNLDGYLRNTLDLRRCGVECRLFPCVSAFAAAYPENKFAQHLMQQKKDAQIEDLPLEHGFVYKSVGLVDFEEDTYIELPEASIPEVRIFIIGNQMDNDFIFM